MNFGDVPVFGDGGKKHLELWGRSLKFIFLDVFGDVFGDGGKKTS